jgi:hypothetical protein
VGVDAHEVNRARAKLALFVADVFASVPRKDQRAKSEGPAPRTPSPRGLSR